MLQQLRQEVSITATTTTQSTTIPINIDSSANNVHDSIKATTEIHDNHSNDELTLSVLCRTPLQVMAACQIDWVQEIILDFLEVIQ